MLIGLKKNGKERTMKIPATLLKELGWNETEDVVATIQEGKLVLSKAPSRRMTQKQFL